GGGRAGVHLALAARVRPLVPALAGLPRTPLGGPGAGGGPGAPLLHGGVRGHVTTGPLGEGGQQKASWRDGHDSATCHEPQPEPGSNEEGKREGENSWASDARAKTDSLSLSPTRIPEWHQVWKGYTCVHRAMVVLSTTGVLNRKVAVLIVATITYHAKTFLQIK
ncbi:unnamed protein product, partial [Heterosigma akashiwo]